MPESKNHHSVSEWLSTVNHTDGEAETAWCHLWERHAPGVTALARERLPQGRKPLADEDDDVVDVFKDLFRGMKEHRFAPPSNRDDLQQILVTITRHRAIDVARRNGFRAAHEVGESALQSADSGDGGDRPMDRVPAADDPPKMSVLACEVLSSLLDSLENGTLRQVAVMQVFSLNNEEIARELGLSVRTVQRKVRVIARRWREVILREQISLQGLRQAFQCWRQTDDRP